MNGGLSILEPETLLHEGDSFRAAFFVPRLLFKGSRLRLHQGKLVCFCAQAGMSYPQLTIERDTFRVYSSHFRGLE
jgi:hypothetical protein